MNPTFGAMNRKTLECLVKVGALDDFGDRAALLESVDRILTLAQSEGEASKLESELNVRPVR